MRALAGGEDDLVIVNSCAVTNEAVRQTRQAIRKAKRARPDARVIVTGCAAQVEPGDASRRCPKCRVGNGKFDSAIRREDLGDVRLRPDSGLAGMTEGRNPRLRHHGGARDRAAPRRRLRRARARVRRGAERLRPSLHLLHHPLWPREQPLGAGRAGGRADQGAGRRGLPRGGADRRRRHQLRPGPARRADARAADRAHPAPRAGRCRGCASPRSTASRWTSGCSSSRPASRASCRTSI